MAIIQYALPTNWIKYSFADIADDLVKAKADILALTTTPYQKNWVEGLQAMQLKREIAGTSQIEGADFSEGELEVAIRPDVSLDELKTRSQRQAHAAMLAYKWIATIPDDRPLDEYLIKEIHFRIVSGGDDCPAGVVRALGQNVTFGVPKHRGCEGGPECQKALEGLIYAVGHEFRGHDPLIQAIALHYHFAAMHPFLDGNGRTARALEALMLQRADLTDRAFIAMSNYYYDEKSTYLGTLTQVRQLNYDLTPFIKFSLKGVSLQAGRLYGAIKHNMEKSIFRNMMYELFNRLDSPRKRVIKERQVAILKILLEVGSIDWHLLRERMEPHYARVRLPHRAIVRDVNGLSTLGAITIKKVSENKFEISVNLQWPQQITESDFLERVRQLPQGKTLAFLNPD